MAPRILLVNPKFPMQHPPLGLGYLSSYLKKYIGAPVEVRLFDETIGGDVLSLVREFKPDLIGISVVTPTFKRAVSLCEQIRTITAVPIIAGGVHVTAFPECLQGSPFEVGVAGEGEATFLELVQHYLETGNIKNENIRGIVFKENGHIVRAPPRPLISDMDSIPPPDRRLFDMKHYTRPGRMAHGMYAKGTSMMPSRGCPYRKCDFCSSSLIWGDKVRFFTPRYVANELESIVDEYGLNFIIFLDDNFTTRLKWLEELAVLLKEKGLTERIRFDCESIAAFMSDSRAELLKKMGCVRIEFGFESGSPRILKILKAGKARIEHNEKAIAICNRHGILSLGNVILGYIDETPAEFKESQDWFFGQPIDYIAPHLYTPYPGTPGWEKATALGLIKPDEMDGELFQTGAGKHNLVVNTIFAPGEIEMNLTALNRDVARRNKILVIDRGLSLKERIILYNEAYLEKDGLVIIESKSPLAKLCFSCSPLMRRFSMIHGDILGALRSNYPNLYSLLRYIKHVPGKAGDALRRRTGECSS